MHSHSYYLGQWYQVQIRGTMLGMCGIAICKLIYSVSHSFLYQTAAVTSPFPYNRLGKRIMLIAPDTGTFIILPFFGWESNIKHRFPTFFSRYRRFQLFKAYIFYVKPVKLSCQPNRVRRMRIRVGQKRKLSQLFYSIRIGRIRTQSQFHKGDIAYHIAVTRPQ